MGILKFTLEMRSLALTFKELAVYVQDGRNLDLPI